MLVRSAALPALLVALCATAPLVMTGCNACSSSDKSAEREKKRNADPLGKARKQPRKKIDREEMRAAKAKMKAKGQSRIVKLTVMSLPVDDREVAPEVAAARALIEGGEEAKVAEGRVALDTWIATHPDDADAYYWRGRSWSAVYDFDSARADYVVATDKAADWAQAWRWAALAAYQADGCDAAMPYLDKVVELAPDQVESYVDRGQCLATQRETDAALADLNKGCEMGSELACSRVTRLERRKERRAKRNRFGNE